MILTNKTFVLFENWENRLQLIIKYCHALSIEDQRAKIKNKNKIISNAKASTMNLRYISRAKIDIKMVVLLLKV